MATDKPEELYIWLADNGNMRKFSKEPFAEGQKYIREDIVDHAIKQAREQALREAAELARNMRWSSGSFEIIQYRLCKKIEEKILSLIGEGN